MGLSFSQHTNFAEKSFPPPVLVYLNDKILQLILISWTESGKKEFSTQISEVVLNNAQLNPRAGPLMCAVLMNFKPVENCDPDTF